MKISLYFVTAFVVLITRTESAKILATIFTPSYSHQVTFRSLWRELAKRGHEIVLLTTDPMREPELNNLKEIDLKGSYEVMEQHGASEVISNARGRGNKELLDTYMTALSKTADWQLSQPEVQDLIRNESEHFDLIMVEMMFPTHLGFVDRFKAPYIGIFSLDAISRVHRAIGNFMHPVVYPDYVFPFRKNLSFLERLVSTVIGGLLEHVYSYYFYRKEDETVKKHFGSNVRLLSQIEKDVDMIFINVNPLFHQLRPAGPNTVQIGGGTHLREPQLLPENIQEFMDSANKGVIYFSLGSTMKSYLISDELKSIILNTLADLPYMVIWKFEKEDLPEKPNNVKIMEWVPQQDLLQHPNVVLFITQCGLQSIEESIFSHVAMVGMPFFGDQSRNCRIMKENGLGLVVDRKNLTKEAFREAITEVINEPIYRKRVREVAELTKDVEMTGLEKAVWWTEYAIRTRGAKHLRNPIVDLPFYKVYLLDVIGFLLVIIAIYLYVIVKSVKFIFRLIFSKNDHKIKKSIHSRIKPKLSIQLLKSFISSDMISLPVNLSPSRSVPTQAMGVVLLLVFAVVPILMQTECARILGIIPTASYSHQAPFQPFWRQLSLRGHQVTVMTTNPANDPSLTNLTEIDLSFTYEIYSKYNFTEFVSDDTNSFLKIAQTMKTMLNEAGDFQFGHPQVQNLIHNKGVTFDLVIVEAQLPAMMSFSWRFNCPMIGIASLDSGMQYHLAMGNPTHPIVNPDLNLPVEDAEDMTFKERMSSFVYHFGYTRYLYDHAYPNLQVKLRTIFGEDLPDLLQLHDNMAMLFINTHPIFHSIRPLNPNTIPIGGGIHLRKPEPLAEEIQSQLDNAKEGAIYVSFGTNVNARMANSVITVILEALGELPYRVLLKADLKLEKTPRNVVTHKWLPQQDILRHPNLKLFVTQGGLQSLQEAVYNAVPLVGIPFLGDQIANVNRMVKKGYGLKLNKNDVTRESIKRVVLEVMNNPKYSEKVRELSAIYREEEMPSLEKAIWWTEYVIRHKGGRHLRSVAVDMPSWKYFMLDVIGFLLSVLVLFTFTCYRITKYVSRLCVKANSKLKVQ
ncbi:uncharacterized protein LOC108903775 [Anoplophora glabripennis]|uniref:uncharacterized protein LOC108903775 n=1 Tax=Anoplophora glabripennis TaxID=217634 RepID=UPI0008757460|nr:uncharacterized protein LOC108903775 [Anoplophora glabripennis]